MPKASLIIPTYNRDEVLCKTIKYALEQTYTDFEIIVINQTKHLNHKAIHFSQSLKSKIKIFEHQPPSLPGARNRGIELASGEIIILIDDDVILPLDFIFQHAKYYDDPEIVGVTGPVYHNKPSPKPSLTFNNEFLKWISYYQFQDSKEKVAYRGAGGNFSFRRDNAFNVGLYDSNFIGTAWGEEYDFSLRLKKCGKKIIYNPRASLFHLAEPSGGAGNRNRFDCYTIYSKSHNLSYLIEKNRLNRLLYLYLIWYVYQQCFFKKEYINTKGVKFLFSSQFTFLKGFFDGFKNGIKKSKRLRKIE